jgi:hypothetical protein
MIIFKMIMKYFYGSTKNGLKKYIFTLKTNVYIFFVNV